MRGSDPGGIFATERNTNEPSLVHPAHNFPVADPVRLTELKHAFDEVKSGKHKAEIVDPLRKRYVFEHFSYLMRR